MAENIERKYIIPLRREFMKGKKYKRTSKAVSALRIFVKKHMKVDNVKILKELNEKMHSRGRKNPPHKIEVIVRKVVEKDSNIAFVNLPNAPLEIKKKIIEKQSIADKVKSTVGIKSEEAKPAVEEKRKILEHSKQPETKVKLGSQPKKSARDSPKATKIIPQSGK